MPRKQFDNPFEEKMSPKSWLIKEKKFEKDLQATRETQFTTGNGYMCLRGVLEETPYDSYAGTYIGGLYDRTGAQITEIINFPNPLKFRIDAYGEKLDPIAMDVVHHVRTLDIFKGELFRHTIYKTTHNKHIDYRSRRFVSMHDKNVVVMEVEITSLDVDITVTAQTIIDSGITNKGAFTEGRKKHYQAVDLDRNINYSYGCFQTLEKGVLVGYAGSLEMCNGNRCKMIGNRAIKMRLKKNKPVTFRKYIVIKHSKKPSIKAIKKNVLGIMDNAIKKGFEKLVLENEKAWAKRWDIADVMIEGDPEATRALRFNMYHLIIAGNDSDPGASIGAKTLSGEGYRGHIFWDTELFILPHFIYTNPKVAKNLLLYRYNRLETARNNALAKGYAGALFPWESADTGGECTPSWAKNFDGKIIKIVTMDEEHHINADIAYAFCHFYRVTGDNDFLWKYALEIMFETAKFWASRVKYNAKRKRYEIHHAMGPDEFHEDVNNNAYTNAMAKWNLLKAAEWYAKYKKENAKKFAHFSKKLGLGPKKVKQWVEIANKIYIPYSKKKNLLEPFDGFFKLKDYRITKLNQHFMPELPISVDWEDISKTQFIKQADIVMLLYLLSENYSLAEKKRNYYYNERRTLHKSSLSPAIHSIMGLEVGDEDKAIHYFAHGLSTDLSDIHGNSADGIHAASCGGTWQAAIMGFGGLRHREEYLELNPHIPEHWKLLTFSIYYRGALLRIKMNHTKTEIRLQGKSMKGGIAVEVYGEKRNLKSSSTNIFKKPIAVKKKSSRRKK